LIGIAAVGAVFLVLRNRKSKKTAADGVNASGVAPHHGGPGVAGAAALGAAGGAALGPHGHSPQQMSTVSPNPGHQSGYFPGGSVPSEYGSVGGYPQNQQHLSQYGAQPGQYGTPPPGQQGYYPNQQNAGYYGDQAKAMGSSPGGTSAVPSSGGYSPQPPPGVAGQPGFPVELGGSNVYPQNPHAGAVEIGGDEVQRGPVEKS
jgi:hypothetical protein